MSYHYLVKDLATGNRRLIEASSPAVAIAHCAKDAFTAQRVEGAVLDMLSESLTVERTPTRNAPELELPDNPPATEEKPVRARRGLKFGDGE